jgi:hypothetical protein
MLSKPTEMNMSRNRKRHRNHHRPRLFGGIPGGPQYDRVAAPADSDVVLSTNMHALPDADAAIDLYLADPADDAQWFADNPGASMRTRSIVSAEVAALGLPVNSVVTVQMNTHGLERYFCSP